MPHALLHLTSSLSDTTIIVLQTGPKQYTFAFGDPLRLPLLTAGTSTGWRYRCQAAGCASSGNVGKTTVNAFKKTLKFSFYAVVHIAESLAEIMVTMNGEPDERVNEVREYIWCASSKIANQVTIEAG